ncbi:hypothetical protein M8J77_024508 [Diaphorina citri]|nr:hypothetical protein M8J77_024508 [Diaphorina citri]
MLLLTVRSLPRMFGATATVIHTRVEVGVSHVAPVSDISRAGRLVAWEPVRGESHGTSDQSVHYRVLSIETSRVYHQLEARL